VYVLYYLMGIVPAPVGRLDLLHSAPPQLTGLYLIDSLLAGDVELFGVAAAQLFLPAVTLGLFALAPLARVTRASMLGMLSSDFIRTARASGLPPRQVLFGYAFRNAMLPVITTLGVVFSFCWGPTFWWRRCLPGPASVPMRWKRWWLRTTPRFRASS
jgi:ABC-type dipeptide/oligopeptide/nickel transport system permease component